MYKTCLLLKSPWAHKGDRHMQKSQKCTVAYEKCYIPLRYKIQGYVREGSWATSLRDKLWTGKGRLLIRSGEESESLGNIRLIVLPGFFSPLWIITFRFIACVSVQSNHWQLQNIAQAVIHEQALSSTWHPKGALLCHGKAPEAN